MSLFCFISINHLINLAAKNYYLSCSDFTFPIVLRGPNGASVAILA